MNGGKPGAADGEGLGPFRASDALTLGVELELMLVDPASGQLASASPALLSAFEGHALVEQVKAEVTQSMIEVTSRVHESTATLEAELRHVCREAQAAAVARGVAIAGGGAHPFRDWPQREIYPDARFDWLFETYGYLMKLFTVFGQHIHVGVSDADDALYLAHVFNGYLPHLIALSASSPLQRGVDTGYHSSRVHVASMFPLSGHLPDLHRWQDFAAYFTRLQATGLVRSMKDFYWDVRPKPEFGTVENRVCDTPLTVALAADLAALCQAIARLHLTTRPALDTAGRYEAYAVNRFRAAKSAFDAIIVDPDEGRPLSLAIAIENLIGRCLPWCGDGDATRLERLRHRARQRETDAAWIKSALAEEGDWARLMARQSGRLLEEAA